MDHGERGRVSIIDAPLFIGELMLDQLVFHPVVGERARGIEAERAEIASEHLTRRIVRHRNRRRRREQDETRDDRRERDDEAPAGEAVPSDDLPAETAGSGDAAATAEDGAAAAATDDGAAAGEAEGSDGRQ